MYLLSRANHADLLRLSAKPPVSEIVLLDLDFNYLGFLDSFVEFGRAGLKAGAKCPVQFDLTSWVCLVY